MKIVSFLIVFSFISFCSYAQQMHRLKIPNTVEIGIAKRANMLLAQLLYQAQGKDTNYVLLYNGGPVTGRAIPKTIGFKETGGTLTQLYNALIEAVRAPGTETSLKFDKNNIKLKSGDGLGPAYVGIIFDRGAFNMTEKEIQELFGK